MNRMDVCFWEVTMYGNCFIPLPSSFTSGSFEVDTVLIRRYKSRLRYVKYRCQVCLHYK